MREGRDAAGELYRQAAGGGFRSDPESARTCAAHFLRFADTLDPHITRSRTLHTLTGFGGFDSARQLRHGFETKAARLTETLTALRNTALRMAAAHLLAADLIRATDDATSRTLLATTAHLDPPS